jgi:hypothetical protein
MKTKVALVAAAAVATLGAQAPVSLGVRGRANANVSLAATGRVVAAVWSAANEAGEEDIEAAVSRDGGASFAEPVRVNRTPGSARTGGEQPPRVVLVPKLGDPALVVVWTSKGVAGTRLVSARSDDGGRTFAAESIVPGSDAPGNRGWESIALDRAGRVHVLWLDHRDAAGSSSNDMSHHMEHNMPMPMQADAVAKAQLSKLYFATLGEERSVRALAAGVCYCCKTSLAVGADGSINAAWRHVYAGNIRDIAFTRSTDGGRTFSAPTRVSEDKWALDGCPENGPAVAVDAKGFVHLAWPTLVAGSSNGAGELGLFYATSRDGRQFSARQTIPTVGTPRHVQIATASDRSLVLAWDESDAGRRHVAFAVGTVDSEGRMNFKRRVATALGAASNPALVATPDSVVVAATTSEAESKIRFQQVQR